MIVIVLTACPAGLRGDLNKWLLEIAAGTFVGNVSARVRDELWERTTSLCKDGRAIMLYSANNEQGYKFKTHRHSWEVVDLDGIELIKRPNSAEDKISKPPQRRVGWSNARASKKSRRPSWGN